MATNWFGVIFVAFLISIGISAVTVYLTKAKHIQGRGAFAVRVILAFIVWLILRPVMAKTPLGPVAGLGVSLLFIAYATRCAIFRCADAGLSRKLPILAGIPLLGLLFLIVLMFSPSREPDVDDRTGVGSPGGLPDASPSYRMTQPD